MRESTTCPVCSSSAVHLRRSLDKNIYDCSRCGLFSLWRNIDNTSIQNLTLGNPNFPYILSHIIKTHNLHNPEQYPEFKYDVLKKIAKEKRLSDLRTQSSNLLTYIGSNISSLEKLLPIENREELAAIIGATDKNGLGYVVQCLKEAGDIRTDQYGSFRNDVHLGKIGLTYKGWLAYDKLKHKSKDSRKAFMAMPFERPELDSFYTDIKTAVKTTGFYLSRIDEDPAAGSIINKIKAEIRSSKFLIAELTYRNPNVYWESGFAEGLSIPVIYLCEDNFFKENKSAFNISVDRTVFWSKDNISKALEDLTNCIKATLPEAAVQESVSFALEEA